MSTKSVLQKSAAVATLAVGLVGAGASAAWAATPAPVPHPSTTPNHPAPPLRPAPVTDAGRIATVNARTLSVRDTNGRITLFQMTAHTTIVKNGNAATVAQLAPQDRVQVSGTRTGTVDTADRIVDTGR